MLVEVKKEKSFSFVILLRLTSLIEDNGKIIILDMRSIWGLLLICYGQLDFKVKLVVAHCNY